MDGSFWDMHSVRRRQHNCLGVLCACVLRVAKSAVSKHRWQIKALGALSLLDPIFPWSPTDSRRKGLCALYGSFLTPEPINMVILVCKCQRMWSSGTTKQHDLSENRWTSEAILICNSVNQLTVYSKHRPCFLTVSLCQRASTSCTTSESYDSYCTVEYWWWRASVQGITSPKLICSLCNLMQLLVYCNKDDASG